MLIYLIPIEQKPSIVEAAVNQTNRANWSSLPQKQNEKTG